MADFQFMHFGISRFFRFWYLPSLYFGVEGDVLKIGISSILKIAWGGGRGLFLSGCLYVLFFFSSCCELINEKEQRSFLRSKASTLKHHFEFASIIV